jgi:hypothetical protein
MIAGCTNTYLRNLFDTINLIHRRRGADARVEGDHSTEPYRYSAVTLIDMGCIESTSAARSAQALRPAGVLRSAIVLMWFEVVRMGDKRRAMGEEWSEYATDSLEDHGEPVRTSRRSDALPHPLSPAQPQMCIFHPAITCPVRPVILGRAAA